MPTSARRFENRAVRLYEAFPPIRFRGDVGIAPYAKGEVLPFNRARHKVLGVPSTPGPAGPPSPSRRGHGLARRFDKPVFPHPSGPLALPPSPEGKASSGGGCVHRSSCLTFRGPLHTRQGSALTPSPGRRGLFSVAVSFLVCSAFLSISAFNASRESNFRSGRRKWVRWREMVRS